MPFQKQLAPNQIDMTNGELKNNSSTQSLKIMKDVIPLDVQNNTFYYDDVIKRMYLTGVFDNIINGRCKILNMYTIIKHRDYTTLTDYYDIVNMRHNEHLNSYNFTLRKSSKYSYIVCNGDAFDASVAGESMSNHDFNELNVTVETSSLSGEIITSITSMHPDTALSLYTPQEAFEHIVEGVATGNGDESGENYMIIDYLYY